MLKISNISKEQIKHTLETSFAYEPGTPEHMVEAEALANIQEVLMTNKEFLTFLQSVAMLARTYDAGLTVIGLVAFGMRLAETIANEKEFEAAMTEGGGIEDAGTI